MKLKIGVHGLTSCYGCQLRMASVKNVLEIAKNFNIEYWYMMSSKGEIKHVDVAFVEGSVSTKEDEEELKLIRENDDILVAMGSCAIYGGVQGMLYGIEYEKAFLEVYGNNTIELEGKIGEPISKYVKVDYKLPGCPPEEDELLYYLACFLLGSYPEEKDYPVCAECRRNGYPCLLIEKNEPCLGALTTAGCKARCIKFGIPCIGCRGPLEEIAWYDSLANVFKEKGMEKEIIKARMEIFGKQYENMDEMVEKVFK